MPVVKSRTVLSGIPVREAMRRRVVRLPGSTDIGQGIRLMIRHKVNALLVTRDGAPCGVVSKTDLAAALYAQIPRDTPLADVTGSQPIVCFPDDPVEYALEVMAAEGVHRLYVAGADRDAVIGAVAYGDVVGLLYRYCRSCERGTAKKRADPSTRLTVREVMTREVRTCRDEDPLFTVIENLSEHRVGAVLVLDGPSSPVGVISKTDLVVAYLRGVQPETPAREVMSRPVRSVPAGEALSAAIQRMLVWDVQRLFVGDDASAGGGITGVLALSDAARFRSGSCRACTAGRLLTG